MKTIKLNGKQFQCPENWDEVTLEMQMKVSADSDAIQHDDLKKYSVLSGYANIPVDVLKRANITDLQSMFKSLTFISKPIEDKPVIEFSFGGSHYYVGQNLVDMQFQDFISIENILEEASGHTYTALPTIIAIIAKKKRDDGVLETIDDYNVLDRAIEFKKLPLPIAHNLSLFFSQSVTLFSNSIQLSLKPEAQEVVTQKQIDSVEIMLKEWDGKGLLTRFVRGILRYCLKHIRRQLDKHSTSTQ